MPNPTLKADLNAVEAALSKEIYLQGQIEPYSERVRLETELMNVLGLKTDAARTYVKFALANALLMDRKQLDYGPRNISATGTYGVITRMNDKMSRLLSLFEGGRRRKAKNESIEDSFRDLSNYGVIATMLETKTWPLV